jgi:membrane fusion protein, multidrug efflux system
MRKPWMMGGAVALAVVVGGLIWALSARSGAAKSDAAVPKDGAKPAVTLEFTPAEVVKPQRMRLARALEITGALTAPRTAQVRARASGALLSLAVAEGERVRAGQVVGQMDLSDLSTRGAERSAALEQARAQLAQAQRQHEANEGLAQQNFISATALQTTLTALEAARAQVRAAEAQVATARVAMRDAALVAPMAGIVSKRHVVPGEKLSFDRPVLDIIDIARLELAGSVPTHEVAHLAPDMPVQVKIEGQADAIAARIDRIAPVAEPGTRSIGVVVAIDNPKERWRAGQYANARVALADAGERLTIPAAAIGSASGQELVWTLDAGKLIRRVVTTGARDATSARVEVLTGIDEQSQVLAARFDNLKEGQAAKVVAVKTVAVAASAASAVAR